jgi:hypothetical protein
VSGQRKALIIANGEYEQEALRNLLAPAADAEALGRVLGDPQIGDFAVQVVRNESSHVIQARIEDLFSESRPDDVLLMHYSGHGLKSESQELFFAASNTRPNRLRATAVSADFVQQCMRDSLSRSIVLLLDCCYAGAFPQGVKVRATGDVHVLDTFSQEKSGGRGRAVITASNAMEYAFEGDQLADDQHRRPSVFTTALVEGLATGDADRDEDGWVSLDELYDYVLDKVREQNPHQTPSRQVDLEGELYLARSRRLRIRAAPIPADLQAAIANRDMYARLGAVGELRSRLASDDLPVAVSAYEALAELARNDTRYVADPASATLSEASVQPAQTELHFGQAEQGSSPPHQIVRLLGPPIARACVPRPSDAWIRVDQVAEGLDISIDTTGTGALRGSLDLKGPTGEAVIAIDIDLVARPPRTPASRGPRAPTDQGSIAPAALADKPQRPPSALLTPVSPSPQSGSPVSTKTPPHDMGGQASPDRHLTRADSEPAGLQPTAHLTSSGTARPNQDGITQQLAGYGLANAFRIPSDNFSRLERVRELINQEVDTGRRLRLAASSGFSYLNPNGPVWADARLGQLITTGVIEIVAVLESPFSDFALTRALANGVDHHHWYEKQTPENLVNLLQYPNVTIRVTDRSVNCSLFLTSQAVYYDPYLWALPHLDARTENNFWVLEFARVKDRDRDCYALLEKHFDFLFSYSVPLEEVLHAPTSGSQCPRGKEFLDFFKTHRKAALNRYQALTKEFTEKVQLLKKDNHGFLGTR